MELPDEAITYECRGLLTPPAEEWTAAAELRARHFVSPARLKELYPRLLHCRSQVAAEREMLNPPAEALPLEAGFINLPQELLDGFRRKQDQSELGKVLALAAHLREESDRVVFLGAGGSYLAARALFGALKSGYHNELPPETRMGVPRVYFEGHGADNDALQELLELLQVTCVDPERREERWSVVCVSKSGLTLEPAVGLRVFRREAAEYYGLRSPWLTKLFAAVTAPSGRLRDLYRAFGVGADGVLTIPENVGGRFSAFTAAGLLPAAVMGLDVRALLLGAAAMTKRFLEDPVERNVVLQYAGLNHLLYHEQQKPLRVLAVWSKKLEGVGPWYDHLLAESLSKRGVGPTPLSQVCTRDLYTRGQQNQDGPRDRVINNLVVKSPVSLPILVQMADHNEDDLNVYNRKGLPDIMNAAHRAVNHSYFSVGRPAADLVLPALSEHTMGQLLQMLMLATVVEGHLMGVNPYGQPGVEAYRRLQRELLVAPAEPPVSPSKHGSPQGGNHRVSQQGSVHRP
jgi:glucose-6-phosphate isomerase